MVGQHHAVDAVLQRQARVIRVGADFAECASVGDDVVLVPYDALVAVQSREG